MAIEPVSNDSGVTMMAMIVGGLVVAVIALFAFGTFDTNPPETTTISIDAPTIPVPAVPSGN